jgi:hypothetical protein
MSLSIVDRLLGKAMKYDPTQSCCGNPISLCECNDLVCEACGDTKAEYEFIGERCPGVSGIHVFMLRGK